MPQTRIVYYEEEDEVPVLDWLGRLPEKGRDRCMAVMHLLARLGYDLRRPAADTLRDGIHELRARYQKVNYRILYAFQDRRTAVLLSGFTKQQQRVPEAEIDRAVRRMNNFRRDPERHTHAGGMSMTRKRRIVSALEITHREFYQGRPDRMCELQQAIQAAEVAQEAYRLRTESGMSIRALAKLLGVRPADIRSLEESDYEGDPAELLEKIAGVLPTASSAQEGDEPGVEPRVAAGLV